MEELWEFDDCIAYLGERGRKDRERAHRRLTQLLGDHFELDLINEHGEQLSRGVTQGLRSTSDSECACAANTLSLLIVSGWSEAEDIFTNFVEHLTAILNDAKASSQHDLIVAVSRLLAWGTFLVTTVELDIEAVIATLGQCIKSSPIADVIDAWTFITSSLSPESIVEVVLYDMIETLEDLLLKEDSLDMKASVCTAMQVLFDGARRSDLSEEYDPAGFTDTTDIQVELSELSSLSIKGPKPRAKRLRKLFQETEQVVMNGVVPTEALTFNQQRFNFKGASTLYQVSYVRDLVGGGFSDHMCNNRLLQNVFDIEVKAKVVKKRMTKQQKRAEKGDNTIASKNTSKERRKDQERKALTKSFN